MSQLSFYQTIVVEYMVVIHLFLLHYLPTTTLTHTHDLFVYFIYFSFQRRCVKMYLFSSMYKKFQFLYYKFLFFFSFNSTVVVFLFIFVVRVLYILCFLLFPSSFRYSLAHSCLFLMYFFYYFHSCYFLAGNVFVFYFIFFCY